MTNNRTVNDTSVNSLSKKEKNPGYLSLLSDLFASQSGKLTSTLRYLYETNYFSGEERSMVEQIALDEIKHLRLLSEAIIAFGGTPIYANSRGIRYSTSSIDYSNDFISMLLINLSSERQSVNTYEKAISLVEDGELNALLQSIKKDEEEHFKAFEELILKSSRD